MPLVSHMQKEDFSYDAGSYFVQYIVFDIESLMNSYLQGLSKTFGQA